MTFRVRILACALLSLLGACSALKKKDGLVEGSENSPEGPTYLIGLVELVNPEQRFVLIRTEGAVKVPPGDQIIAIDATGAQSKLKVTPEKKQNFLTADILEGNPKVGNLIVHRPAQQQAKPVTPPTTPVIPQVAPTAPVTPAEFLTPAGAQTQSPATATTPVLDGALSPGSSAPIPAQIGTLPPVIR
jgi:hypothetical protein